MLEGLQVIGRVDEGRETVKSWLKSFRGPTRFQELGNLFDRGWRRGQGKPTPRPALRCSLPQDTETDDNEEPIQVI